MPGVDDVSEHGHNPGEKYVYIAGPYTKGDWGRNVERTIDAAQRVLELGHIPFVPHTMTGLWSVKYENRWIEFDLKWLEKCDMMIRLDGDSDGADSEEQFAKRNGITVFGSVEEFEDRVGEPDTNARKETRVDTDTVSGLLTGGQQLRE